VLRRPVESAQYVSIRYSERLAEADIEPSVGSRSDSYDTQLHFNAATRALSDQLSSQKAQACTSAAEALREAAAK
jgi:hypothetical protein